MRLPDGTSFWTLSGYSSLNEHKTRKKLKQFLESFSGLIYTKVQTYVVNGLDTFFSNSIPSILLPPFPICFIK
jgi:hypothetical protein